MPGFKEDLFLTNTTSITFLDKLKEDLTKCSSFSFSVSFIKMAGLQLLKKQLINALERGAKGLIITSTYQNFTDISSLVFFLNLMIQYPNFKVHLDYNSFLDCGFHSKGYLFEFENGFELIVGSSNITRYALAKNVEWDVSIFFSQKEDSFASALVEINSLYLITPELSQDLIDKYKAQLEYAISQWDMDCDVNSVGVTPNRMQREALKDIIRYRNTGCSKALVVAATASGKTYLAAFDAYRMGIKKLLYIVTKETILRDACRTFKKVFGSSVTFGFYTGNEEDLCADFIFATNIMMAKNIDLFAQDEFEYIVLDECHHSTSDSYKKILSYFTPTFCLGLTATPERMDNQDVFSLFDNNVPYELRLRDALLNDLIVPFHYYGVANHLVDYSDQAKKDFINQMASPNNIEYICEEIKKHRNKIQKLKCLAFCRSIEHARVMADKIGNCGFKTICLDGSNQIKDRMDAFSALQDDNNPLEILFTVDILNEGVDIPAVNMVLFLRPTESSTVFIQQLGRGLRKYKDKEYVTVLDFIGNSYTRSIQIALALGSLTKTSIIEKKLLMDLIESDFKSLDLPGVKITFDALSKEDILKYLSKENFNVAKYLKSDYFNFKKYIQSESFPSHVSYLTTDYAPDLMRFMKCSLGGHKLLSYYSFLLLVDPDNTPVFSEEAHKLIDLLSDMLPLVRLDEYYILQSILEGRSINDAINYDRENNSKFNEKTFEHALKQLKKKNIINTTNQLYLSHIDAPLSSFIEDLLEYGIRRYKDEFGEFSSLFKPFANYYKEQIMLVLLEDSLMYLKGTKFFDNGETYIFVGIRKDKNKQELLNYKDKFLSKTVFQWESENNTTTDNATGLKIKNTKVVHLFVRKMDHEDGITLPFTYMGQGEIRNVVPSKNGKYPTLTLDIVLNEPVPVEFINDFEIPEVSNENG